jgi:hypothetical protein
MIPPCFFCKKQLRLDKTAYVCPTCSSSIYYPGANAIDYAFRVYPFSNERDSVTAYHIRIKNIILYKPFINGQEKAPPINITNADTEKRITRLSSDFDPLSFTPEELEQKLKLYILFS